MDNGTAAWEPDSFDRRSSEVEEKAFELACERGGQTTPLSAYDLDRAEEIITGEVNIQAENARLRKALEPFASMAENSDSMEAAMASVGAEMHSILKRLADYCRIARTTLKETRP